MKKTLMFALMTLSVVSAASAEVTAEFCTKSAANNCEGWTDECTELKHKIRSGVIKGEQIDSANACSQ